MSNPNDYENCINAIMAMPEVDVKYPSIPVDIYIQEAESLHKWSADDISLLSGVGLSKKLIEALPVRTGACREAQSIWDTERNIIHAAEQEWKVQSVVGYEIRNDLLHAFRYAFRKDEKLLRILSDVVVGTTHTDIIQDLNGLAVLGDKNSNMLEKINFDVDMLVTAASVSDSLADLLATANGKRDITSKTKNIRDRAYTYLKEVVDEVRQCGRYVFRKKPERLKGYQSQYKNRHRISTA